MSLTIGQELAKMFEASNSTHEIDALCQKHGAAFVIDSARAWVIAKERAAAEEHSRWRDHMLAATKAAEERDHG